MISDGTFVISYCLSTRRGWRVAFVAKALEEPECFKAINWTRIRISFRRLFLSFSNSSLRKLNVSKAAKENRSSEDVIGSAVNSRILICNRDTSLRGLKVRYSVVFFFV